MFDDAAGRIRSVLDLFPEVTVGILYGSLASDSPGAFGPTSDIDLAIAGVRPLSVETKAEILNQVSASLGREVDLLDLNRATGTVFKEAISRGKVFLNKDSSLLGRILCRMIHEEEDFQRFRRKLMSVRRKKVFDVG